jgi:cysteine desulfurase / selenocysteine lyase
MIYLDNAATSWPKPPCVAEAMTEFLEKVGANPGRSAHRLSVESGRIVYTARDRVARFFGASDPLRVIFGLNGTEGLNLAVRGLLSPGDHVITSSMEHNSMMRPLRALGWDGVEVTVIPCSRQGVLDPDDVSRAIRSNTTLLAVNHASNVTGTLQPIGELGAMARRAGILLLVDAAQTGGAYPIDMVEESIDLLAFTGHKSLLGPTGTGGLIIGERVDVKTMKPLKRGGTGSNSELEEQPDFLPDAFESGTPNVMGLAGLDAGIQWIMERGIEAIRSYEERLTQRLIDGLISIPAVTVYGTGSARLQTGVVSFNIEGRDPAETGLLLDDEHEIMCRVGLHCAPAAHGTIGTFPVGTVRFGLSIFNTEGEIDAAVEAVRRLREE